jgi:hypothetical protein
VSVSAILKFLGLAKDRLLGSTGLTNNSKLTTTFKIEDPKINRSYLMTIDTIIAKNIQAVTRVLKSQRLEDADLYVISETIKSKKLTYQFDKKKTGQVNLDLAFKPLGSTTDSLKWDNTDGGALSYTMPKDLIIFYKAYKLLYLHGADGDDIKTGEQINSSELLFTARKSK